MCLSVPGKLVSVEGDDPDFRTGRVDFRGVSRTVQLAYTPDAVPGDFLLVHVGFSVKRMNAAEAQRILCDLAALEAS